MSWAGFMILLSRKSATMALVAGWLLVVLAWALILSPAIILGIVIISTYR